MIDYSNHNIVWWAMKTTYKRELKAKAILDECGVENFVAMESRTTTRAGRRYSVKVPAIHNLIFIKGDGEALQRVKQRINFLHNRLCMVEGRLSPIVVSERDMEQFISLSRQAEKSGQELKYIDLMDTPLAKGTRVRIIGGEFAGYEGTLTRVKGCRDRRVVLNIESLVAVAMTSIDASLIEKI